MLTTWQRLNLFTVEPGPWNGIRIICISWQLHNYRCTGAKLLNWSPSLQMEWGATICSLPGSGCSVSCGGGLHEDGLNWKEMLHTCLRHVLLFQRMEETYPVLQFTFGLCWEWKHKDFITVKIPCCWTNKGIFYFILFTIAGLHLFLEVLHYLQEFLNSGSSPRLCDK